MITLKEVRDAYEALSGTMSSVVRQINFAGIAIAWIFVNNEKNNVNQLLVNSCFFISLSIFLDALQYFFGTLTWHLLYTIKHKKNIKDDNIDVKESELLNVLPWVLFYVKCILTVVGYIYILRFFIIQFSL